MLFAMLFAQVPADMRLIETRDLILDRSTLTGECEELEGTVECTDENFYKSKNIAFKSTWVTSGEGRGICVLKGDATSVGKLANLTAHTNSREIILDAELDRLVTVVITLAIIIAVVVLVWMLTFFRIVYPEQMNVNQAVQNVVGAMVSFVPNSLPLTVAASLLIMAKRMEWRNVLVKNLSIMETFSALNVLACDKTGTLTHNRMCVVNVATSVADHVDLKEMSKKRFVRTRLLDQLLHLCALCNNARYEHRFADGKETSHLELLGDATDAALLEFVGAHDSIDAMRAKYTLLADVPFTSKNKFMMKIIRYNANGHPLFDAGGDGDDVDGIEARAK